MRLAVPIATVLTALAVLVGGCARAVGGEPAANPAHALRPVSGGELNTILLTPAQLSEVVGGTLRLQVDAGQPIGDVGSGECSVVDNVGSRAFVGDEFLAFHLLLLADESGPIRQHVVSEAVAIYPDTGSAAAAFAEGSALLPECDGKEFTREARWRFAINEVDAHDVRWNKEQVDLPFLWVCYGQARLRVNVIVAAMVCRFDDDGKAQAEAVVNRMAASVWELAGH